MLVLVPASPALDSVQVPKVLEKGLHSGFNTNARSGQKARESRALGQDQGASVSSLVSCIPIHQVLIAQGSLHVDTKQEQHVSSIVDPTEATIPTVL